MKRFVTSSLACFCLLSNTQAFSLSLSDFGNPFVDVPRYAMWRSEMEEKVNSTFALITPKAEQNKWQLANDKVVLGDINEYAEANWIPKSDKLFDYSECVTIYFENMPNAVARGAMKKYENMTQYIDKYKEDTDDDYKFDIKVLQINDKEAIVELHRYEKGVSGLVKKDPQAKRIERWIMSGDWLISLRYSIRPSKNEEKGLAWEQLKNTWLERFSNVQF